MDDLSILAKSCIKTDIVSNDFAPYEVVDPYHTIDAIVSVLTDQQETYNRKLTELNKKIEELRASLIEARYYVVREVTRAAATEFNQERFIERGNRDIAKIDQALATE